MKPQPYASEKNKNILKQKNIILFIAVPLFCGAAMLLTACKQEIEVIEDIPPSAELPDQIITGFNTVYTDSGKIQLVAESPEMISYGNAEEPYSEFPEGVKVYFYNGKPGIQSQLSSKYAMYYQNDNLWEARDSVVAINNKGEILETELLFWDEAKKLIYSDKFVKITTADEVIMGEKFESNQDFSDWTIHQVTGTFYLEDEEK